MAGRRSAQREDQLTDYENQLAHLARVRKLLAVIGIKIEHGATSENLKQSALQDATEANQLTKQVQHWIDTEINRRNLR